VYDAQDANSVKLKNVTIKKLKRHDKSFILNFASYLNSEVVERLACKQSDSIITVSEREKRLINDKYSPSTNINVFQSGTRIIDRTDKDSICSREDLNLPKSNILVGFHGNFSYGPNQMALEQILDNISPNVIDDVKFVIAGANLPEINNPKVFELGFVDDLSEFLMAIDIAIAPITSGSGTKIKMLDYLGAGLPIITTKKGAEGLAIEHKKNVLIADEIEEFPDVINRLSANEPCRVNLGSSAKEVAKERHNWNTITNDLFDFYTHLYGEE
jgi:glycosyltransferase involved in cell wall biosynthesis